MPATDDKPARGKILISEPSLSDGFFAKSVVLLVDHNAEGSFGFVVNKPSDVKLNEITTEFGQLDIKVFFGGPVKMDNLYYLHTRGEEISNSVPVIQGLWWGGDLEVVKELLLTGELKSGEIRFYIGYSGWSPGQLDHELSEKAWVVRQAEMQHVWTKTPGSIWRKLLLSLGKDYALWINHPSDPSLN
jgi:putative transcriptional regulator